MADATVFIVDDEEAVCDSVSMLLRSVGLRLADGQANKAVALELDISQRTVELHRARIMQKMGVRSLAQLVQMLLVVRGS